MIDQVAISQAVQSSRSAPDQILVILSWIVNLVGVAIGVAGLIYAIIQGKKTKTAEALVKKVKMDLYHQKASQVFVQMSSASSTLTSSIRAHDWEKGMDSLISLGGQIANALGAFPELVGTSGIEALQSCASDLAHMFDSMPIAADGDCDVDIVKSLLVASVTVDFRLQTIAGQMRLAIELEKPDERDSSGTKTSPNFPGTDGRGQALAFDPNQDDPEQIDLGEDPNRV
jgi:hypothetical protein